MNTQYRLKPERPFLRSERAATTVLMGGLTYAHEQMVVAGLTALGYKCEALPNTNLDSYALGREHCSNGLCNPAYFTIGNLLAYLRNLRDQQGLSVEQICDRYVFYTAGSYGPCRFGMYESEYRFALQSAGFGDFRVLTFQQSDGIVQTGPDAGLDIEPMFALVQFKSIMFGDLANEIYHQIKPYELVPGAAEKARRRAVELLKPAMAPPPPGRLRRVVEKVQALPFLQQERSVFALRWLQGLMLIIDYLRDDGVAAMVEAAMQPFDAVEVDRLQPKPLVKITGEFWAQTTESAGNYEIFALLEKLGAEILVEPVTTWMDYLIIVGREVMGGEIGTARKVQHSALRKKFDRLFSRVLVPGQRYLLQRVSHILRADYNRLRAAAGGSVLPLVDQHELIELAGKYYEPRLTGGEGYLEIGKTIHYTQDHLAHMVISLKPFGCMPSTQSDGAQPAVLRDYPDILYLPIETSADGEGMALSRVQMMLAEARERARKEWQQSLAELPYSLDAMRAYIDKNPQWRRGLLPLEHGGDKVMTASRFARLLCAQMQREQWTPSEDAEIDSAIASESARMQAEQDAFAPPQAERPAAPAASACASCSQCAPQAPVMSPAFMDASKIVEVRR